MPSRRSACSRATVAACSGTAGGVLQYRYQSGPKRRCMRHLPNLICLLRIALIWPIIASISRRRTIDCTLLLFFIAAASDGLDGFLAKRFHWTSELGKVLDPIADKLLLMAVFLVATWYGLIPRWLTVLAVARDVHDRSGGASSIASAGDRCDGRPMISSKINTLLQLLYVLAMVAQQAFGVPPQGCARGAGAADADLDAAAQRLSVRARIHAARARGRARLSARAHADAAACRWRCGCASGRSSKPSRRRAT